MTLGTSNCVNYSTRIPKHSAKYVYHTEISVYSTARASISCETEQRRTRNLSSTPWIPRAPLREEARGQRILHREFGQEEMQKVLLGYPRRIHTRRKVPQKHV